jgi:histidinol dehydrogenase
MPTGAAMNERPDQLGRCIDDRLAEMIRQITDARHAFTSAGQHANWAIEAKLEQVRTRTAARSSQFQKERERVNSKVKRALANAKERVEDWKKTGQREKLRQYAAEAENYALAAILDANDAIDDALIAAMESLTARVLAEGEMRKS